MLKLSFIVALYLIRNDNAEVAYLDLSAPSRTEGTATHAVAGGRGGGGYDGLNASRGPDQSTLPVSVRLVRFALSSDPVPWKSAIELTVTNTSPKPVVLPIGIDKGAISGLPAASKQLLLFQVRIGTAPGEVVGTGALATNKQLPETLATLNPGDFITVRVPFDTRPLTKKLSNDKLGDVHLNCAVMLFSVETTKGVDVHEQIGKTIASSNDLVWLN